MRFHLLTRVLTLVLMGIVPAQAAAQTPPVAAESAPVAQGPAEPTGDRLRVYLDCFDCFPQFLRDEIDFVDFVRQPQDAEVHLLSSGRQTGGGGREVILRFVGRGRFEGHDHDLRAVTLVGDSENTRREVVLRTVLVGLLDYTAHDGIPQGLNLSVSTESAERQDGPTDDPWNLWVFEVGGNASFNQDERSSERNMRFNASADRVSEAWKINLGGGLTHNVEEFKLEDEDDDDPLEVTRRNRNFNWFVAKSYGPHFSVGVSGNFSSSTFNNNKFSARVSPAIEYSVFPYEDYATRQLRLGYEIGVVRARYDELTIFDKLEETIGQHQASITLDQRQPWGSLEAGFEFSQYLHDLSLYRIEVDGELSFRIARGLEVELDGSASRIRDQISLPGRGATPEEILLRLRQLQSGYDVRFSVGLSYSFGSIFNNVVNPRFGGGGGGFGGGGGGF